MTASVVLLVIAALCLTLLVLWVGERYEVRGPRIARRWYARGCRVLYRGDDPAAPARVLTVTRWRTEGDGIRVKVAAGAWHEWVRLETLRPYEVRVLRPRPGLPPRLYGWKTARGLDAGGPS